MPKIVHFEIPVDDADRAISFYQKAFGWKVQKWEGQQDYWLVTAGEKDEAGIDGAFSWRKDFVSMYGNLPAAVTNVIGVSSVDKYLDRLEKAGGKIVAPKSPIPGVGYAAYFRDPEGNVLGLFESDETAKAGG